MSDGEPAEDQVEDCPETYEIEIYKIEHKTDKKLERYVGCTKQFKTRMIAHKTRCNNPKAHSHNLPLYKYIRSHGGWNEWEMTCLATEYVENKHEQLDIENQYITLMGATLNRDKPGATQRSGGRKEYMRQKARDRDAKLGLHGNSQPCACGGSFTKKNENQHKRRPMHKRYEEAIRTSSEYVPLKEKGTACACGGLISKGHESRHEQSQRHKRYEASLHQDTAPVTTNENQ